MPVLETDAQDRNKGNNKPWGCINHLPYAESYRAPDGYDYYTSPVTGDIVAEISVTAVAHTMSTECRNDISLKDPKCEGCMYRGVAEAYWIRYRAKLLADAGTATPLPEVPAGIDGPLPAGTEFPLPELATVEKHGRRRAGPVPMAPKPVGPANASASGAPYDPARLWREN